MKFRVAILFFTLCFVCNGAVVFAQNTVDPSTLSVEVQKKMDQNKQSGKDIWTGISHSFVLDLGKVWDKNSADAMFAKINSKITIESYLHIEKGRVKVTLPGRISIKELKAVIAEVGSEIYEFRDEVYFISK
ncbi:MAG TPA: hypothetical protein PK637_08370 [Flavobacteriales bacterium]|nr:hypothetical protein [Flavobacteriales bacterium]HRE96766.1 hypothetical protein [Flavobacteriales bacterium]HRJ37739.1 hypothetical protein [Flavobacteriales bacterium]